MVNRRKKEEALEPFCEAHPVRVIDLTKALEGEVYLSANRCFQAEEELFRDGEILVVKVRSAGIILPPAEERRKRWLLCRFPAGRWAETRSVIVEALRAKGIDKRTWRRVDIHHVQRDRVRTAVDASQHEYKTLLLRK